MRWSHTVGRTMRSAAAATAAAAGDPCDGKVPYVVVVVVAVE
jgi:hypothetical protein